VGRGAEPLTTHARSAGSPRATRRSSDRAARASARAFEAGDFPQHERAAVLDRAAELVGERSTTSPDDRRRGGQAAEDLPRPRPRCVDTLTFSAVEARKLTGGHGADGRLAAGAGKLGVMMRVPFGVVGAISPFNFPLNLVAHKLGPALAAGNAGRPQARRADADLGAEAGRDPGRGGPAGGLAQRRPRARLGGRQRDRRARADPGAQLHRLGRGRLGNPQQRPPQEGQPRAGLNAPLIVHADGDWETAADKAKLHAFSHAGQSCISIQRILVHEDVADDFTERLSPTPSAAVGDPLDPGDRRRPLISPGDRDRVKEWDRRGGRRRRRAAHRRRAGRRGPLPGADPARAPPREAKVWCEEIFGPVATIDRYADFAERCGWPTTPSSASKRASSLRDMGRGLEAAPPWSSRRADQRGADLPRRPDA
jgi:acyl-CoA reductase-like NAD-dependent aldehyde dehydrogenase